MQYVHNIEKVGQNFIEELFNSGCITSEEKKELEDELNN
jgi:hypothetical protein